MPTTQSLKISQLLIEYQLYYSVRYGKHNLWHEER